MRLDQNTGLLRDDFFLVECAGMFFASQAVHLFVCVCGNAHFFCRWNGTSSSTHQFHRNSRKISKRTGATASRWWLDTSRSVRLPETPFTVVISCIYYYYCIIRHRDMNLPVTHHRIESLRFLVRRQQWYLPHLINKNVTHTPHCLAMLVNSLLAG